MPATDEAIHRIELAAAQRIVVKIGTAVLTDDAGHFDQARLETLCGELAAAAQTREIVVVSSGAIALGVERLGLVHRPRDLPFKQASAAVGQCRLMHSYEVALGKLGHPVGQLLLTHEDVADRRRYLNARQTLAALLALKAIPIINENDTVSVDEIQFGDNDALAGLVTGLCDADLLVLLSDVAGLHTADPRLAGPTPTLIREVHEITPAIAALASGASSGLGTGGMGAKIRAARLARDAGAATIIAPGRVPGTLTAVLRGDPVGTRFQARGERLRSRQRWIANALRPRGRLRVDAGARAALLERGGSLLSSGLLGVEGDFERGSAVEILEVGGAPFARGLCGYAASELRQLCGAHSSEIEQRLGYKYLDEIVHRDDLVLLDGASGA